MIISINDFKDYINYSKTDTSKDTYISRIIEYCQDVIEQFCQQKLEETERTHERKGSMSNLMLIPTTLPVVDATVEEKNTLDSSYVSIDVQLVKFDSVSYVFRNAGFDSYYKITYTAGFTEADIPNELKKVLLEMAAVFWREQKTGTGEGTLGMQNVASNFNSVSSTIVYKDMFESVWKKQLMKYRKPTI